MRNLVSIFALSLLVFGIAASAMANTGAQEEIGTLDTVIVTADRSEETVREVSQSVIVISEEDIQRTAAVSVVDVLKRYGIQTSSDGGVNYGAQSVVMRGAKSSMHGFDLAGDVLVLVDGRRAASDNLSIISLGNVQRIEIIRGPGAVQYGSSAIGGVINILTKRGAENPELKVEIGGTSFGGTRAQAFASGRAGQIDAAAWISYVDSGNIRDGEGNTLDNSGMGHMAKFGANIGWNINEYNRLGLNFHGVDGQRLESGPVSTQQYQNRDYYLADLLYEGSTPDEDFSWMARYFLGRTSYEISREKSGQRANQSDNANRIQGGQAQLSWSGLDWLTLTGGTDVLYYDMEQNQPHSVHTAANRANYTDSDYLNIGAFLLGKVYLLENRRLVLSAGGRYDYFKVNTDTDYAPGQSNARQQHSDSSVDHFIPSLGIAYSPWNVLKLRANYSHAFKMPTPRQLGGIYYMSNLFIGNPDLKPEKSRTWDVGFDLAWQALNVSFSYFSSTYEDMIVALAPVGGERHYDNLDKAYIDGIEGSVSFDLGHHFDWPVQLQPYFSFTHLTRFEDNNDVSLLDVSRNSFSWGLLFAFPEYGLRSSLDFTYYGGNRLNSASSLARSPGGATVADFNLSIRLWEFEEAGDLSLKLAVNNIFNKQYSTNKSEFYMPGTNFYVGVAYTY